MISSKLDKSIGEVGRWEVIGVLCEERGVEKSVGVDELIKVSQPSVRLSWWVGEGKDGREG